MFSLLSVFQVCDSNLNFLSVNAAFPGSCHDSGIWRVSPLKRFLRNAAARGEYWLLGDAGYPHEPWLMVPYENAVQPHEEIFNKVHIKARNCIERAFGCVKAKFRCLLKHRTLHYHPLYAASIKNACFILHNFSRQKGCIDHETAADEEVGAILQRGKIISTTLLPN